MYTAFVLVKNLTSNSKELKFSKFELYEIQHGDTDALRRAQKLFSKGTPLYGDWVYERSYDNIQNQVEKISYDIEDTLFLLRLFKVGDLVFIRPCIKDEDGNLMRQLPYRVMLDIPEFHKYELNPPECCHFDNFAEKMISQENWSSTWFQTARRFFLYGSSKEFNPQYNVVDRIVDYIISIECILVPERDFVARRLRERVVSLIKRLNVSQKETTFINKYYDLRSKIVHGDNISSKKDILEKYNVKKFEEIIRKVICESIQALPTNEKDRKEHLKRLFDVNDDDRAKKVIDDFRSIKCEKGQKSVFDFILKHIDNAVLLTKNRKPKTENS